MSTVAQVRALHSELDNATTYPDDDIGSALVEAKLLVSRKRWGSRYDRGVALLAAHIVVDAQPGGQGSAQGTIVEDQMGPARIRYSDPGRGAVADDDLNLSATIYGRRFKALRRKRARGPFAARSA